MLPSIRVLEGESDAMACFGDVGNHGLDRSLPSGSGSPGHLGRKRRCEDPPPEAAIPLSKGDPVGRGSFSGIVANDGYKSASFFFGDDPPDFHYTYFSVPFDKEIYHLFHEKLELLGSDMTGNYWHYRTLRPDIPFEGWPLPRDWYIPKDPVKHPAVWFQTQEPGAKFEYYGRALSYINTRWPSGKPGKK